MKTCLIVDDNRVIRKVTRQILESFGFMCWEAEQGQAALESCGQQMPDLVLLDWNMPVMNGMDFMRALRQLPGGGDVQIVFCTVENTLDKVREALAASANEYIMKPFDAEIMHGKLDYLGLIEN